MLLYKVILFLSVSILTLKTVYFFSKLYKMLFYIIYNSEINDKYFRLWLNHNKRINADFKIYVEKKELENFKNNYTYY